MRIATFEKRIFARLSVVQATIIWIALASFVVSLGLFLAESLNLIALPQRFIPGSLLACLAVPLSVLLVYELVALVRATAGSYLGFLIVMFEVVSLILLRDLLKRLDELQSGFQFVTLVDLTIVGVGSVVLYFLIEVLQRISNNMVRGELKERLPGNDTRRLHTFKSLLSISLFIFLAAAVVYELAAYALGQAGAGLNTSFVKIVFAGLIIYSIVELLIVLLINSTYEIFFEHSALVVSSVVVLVGLEAPTAIRVPLVIAAILFTIATLYLHGFARGQKFGQVFKYTKPNSP